MIWVHPDPQALVELLYFYHFIFSTPYKAVEPRLSNLIHPGKMFKQRFVKKPNFLCHLRDRWRIMQVAAWKGCRVENWHLKFFVRQPRHFVLWTVWSRTELFENQDFENRGLTVLFPGMRRVNWGMERLRNLPRPLRSPGWPSPVDTT